jgi:hypothetical protein
VGLTTLPCKKKIVEKPPRNSAGFCGGGQGLSCAVEPRKEEEEEEEEEVVSNTSVLCQVLKRISLVLQSAALTILLRYSFTFCTFHETRSLQTPRRRIRSSQMWKTTGGVGGRE